MPIPDNQKLCAEIAHMGTVASGGGQTKNFANVYHFRRSAVVGVFDSTAIANEFINVMVPAITDCLNVDYTTTGVSVRCVNDALDPPITVADATPGNVAGERLPDYNSVMILMRTPARGRHYRGRKHYGPISEADSVDDVLTAGAVTLFTTLITTLNAGFTDANGNFWLQVVLSKTLSNMETNPTNIVIQDVTQYLLNKSLGTMRRRKIKTVR